MLSSKSNNQEKAVMRTSICVAVVTAGMHLFALEETINGYTWRYRINGDTAEI